MSRGWQSAFPRAAGWIFALAAPLAAADVTAQLTHGMARVPRTALYRPDLPLLLSAARGEWEPCQVVITGSPEELANVTLEARPLNGPDGITLPAPEILREHFVTVSRSTPMSSLPVGDYPDALVPQSFKRQPTPVGELVNQPYWLDLFVPYGTQPGDYVGELTVLLAGKPGVTLNYTVHVWNFDLPVIPRLRTSIMTVWRRIAEAHGFDPSGGKIDPKLAALLDKYYELLASHRLSIDQCHTTYPDPDTGKLDKAALEAGLRRHLLHRHASTISLPIWPAWPFADPLDKDRGAALRYVATWAGVLNKLGAGKRGYVILGDLDEPNNHEAYALVRRWGEFFNEVEARGKFRMPLLVTEQPTPQDDWWGRLDGSVDIWSAHFSKVWEDMEAPTGRRDIARRIAAGDEVWAYPALVQMPEEWESLHDRPKQLRAGHPPVWATDYPAMNYRVWAWLLPRHVISGITYWDTLFVSPGIDPWVDAGTFKHPSGDVYNGDGLLIYPATQRRHGANMPVASIRLKWLREAAEDYEYLMLAEDEGLRREAAGITESFARGFGEWDGDIAKLYEARRALAVLIEKKGGRL